MKRSSKQPKVVQMLPRPGDLEDTVHRLAEDSANVSWSTHSQDQMIDRGISDLQALKVLRTGMIDLDDIERGKNQGEWKCKMVANIKGNRDVGVVTIVSNGQRLFVKTVEWEDMR